MIYILNKNKIISYIIASFIVFGLFVLSTSVIPNKDIELLKVSSNIVSDNLNYSNNINNMMNNSIKY